MLDCVTVYKKTVSLKLGMVEFCTKILYIMCLLDDYVQNFCQLCASYVHHVFRFVSHSLNTGMQNVILMQHTN